MEVPNANGRIYYVTDGRTYLRREIYEWMCEALGRRVPGWSVAMWEWRAGALVGDMAGHMMRRTLPLDNERLEKLVGSA